MSEQGYPYFYNVATKETTWTLPEGAVLVEPQPQRTNQAMSYEQLVGSP